MGGLFKHKSRDYLYIVGDIVGRNNSKLVIDLVRKEDSINGRLTTIKAYKCKCIFCNGEYIQDETFVNDGDCPICGNHPTHVVVGINDILTTRPEIASLMLFDVDRIKHTKGSRKSVWWRCPYCGEISYKEIRHVSGNGWSCVNCSEGISVPEKIFMSFCKQIKELGLIVDYQYQYSPSWAVQINDDKVTNKFYDFIIYGVNNRNSIIETHGLQHYEDICKKGTRTLIEEQENDKYKELIAKQNTDYEYVVLDMRVSTIECFIQSLKSSILLNYYNISIDVIDWNRLSKDSAKNYKKTVWELWDSGIHDINVLSQMVKLSHATIISYLKEGSLYGNCNYTKEESNKLGYMKTSIKLSKSVICLTTGEIYKSITEAENSLSIHGSVGKCCRGNLTYGGIHPITKEKLVWMYYDEYLKQQESLIAI